MPKAAAEKTTKQKNLDAAKAAYDKAVEADNKNSNAATKKALADAETVYNNANNEVRRESFVRVAGNRVKKARIAIRNLGNVSNARTYAYTQADIETAEKGINEMWAAAKAKMLAGLNTKTAAPAATDNFSF